MPEHLSKPERYVSGPPYERLRAAADAVERYGLRSIAAVIRSAIEEERDDERTCPIQDVRGGSVRAIPWGLAEMLYPAYGHGQSLERMAERGGFGRAELGMLAVGMYGTIDRQQASDGRWNSTFPLLDIYRGCCK